MMTKMCERLQHALDIRYKKAADLVRDLGIPKSAVSQYLSGKSQRMDSRRLYIIAKYLDVSEAWLMGFDVPMERGKEQKNNDALVDIIALLRTDDELLALVQLLCSQTPEVRKAVLAILK